jgi:hypothetical protein
MPARLYFTDSDEANEPIDGPDGCGSAPAGQA